MEKQRQLEENNIVKPVVNPLYYQDRNAFKHVQVAAFLTRYRNINSNSIKDNDNIMADGFKVIDEVAKMSDIEFGTYYHMMLKNINKEDIFDNFL